ncbi:MarR family transcriptional regulator, partial [Streptomyces sp. SID14478]|uniref:MarR family transcriptional regulator n=1 Tax=Streptomyces sp. SID14478 TaxID=2706073 RepID=UPI0013D8FCCA
MKADLRAAAPADTALSGPSKARDRGSVRRENLALVLRILRDAGPRSRARIAADTGLPKPTVTSLVSELVALGLAGEGTTRREGSVGRPGTLVHVGGRHICGIGVEISTSYVRVLALTLDGEAVYEHRGAVAAAAAGPDAVLDLTARAVTVCTTALERAGVR